MAKSNEPRFLGRAASVFLGDDDTGDQSDFRDVPDSDKDSGYSDMGMRGSYAPHNRDAFPDSEGLKWFSGYGADEADLSRGFVEPKMNEDPAYDLINYKNRSTTPRSNGGVDEGDGNTAQLPKDYEFRGRNKQSRGFLTRPHLPTER